MAIDNDQDHFLYEDTEYIKSYNKASNHLRVRV